MAHLREQREMAQLRAQIQELMHINSEWDKEYRELQEAFRRYKADAQQTQTENHVFIARLKDKVASLEEERNKLEDELARYQRELHALRERLAVAESVKTSLGRSSESEEEVTLLRQQVKAYQEDFEAEKRDKERLQSAAIRHEAEKTSLKLQLDRCQTDLAHFTAEANRLAQQLKLKNEYEDDKFRKHLENQGFVPRSPGGYPPLDPYVEIDQNAPTLPPRTNRINGRNHMHNGSIVANGHDFIVENSAKMVVNGERMSPVRRQSTNSTPNSSCRLVSRDATDNEESVSAPARVNSDHSDSIGSNSGPVDSDCGTNAVPQPLPPLASKGRHVCPRCARRFQDKKIFQQHKDRCLA